MSDRLIEDVPNCVLRDLFHMICGEPLGSGLSRKCFVYSPNKKLVVKLEVGAEFQNAMEYETWCLVRNTPWGKWFAPVTDISGCGTALLMKRTKPLKALPATLPSFFWDVKLANFGLIGRQVVCHDYGFTDLMKEGLRHARMKKVVQK